MLEVANVQVLELGQPVLVRSQEPDGLRHWTGVTIHRMNLGGAHRASCDGRMYGFKSADPLRRSQGYCRCDFWIVPFDNVGRWAGMPIKSEAEMELWWLDHVDNAPDVDEPAELYDYDTEPGVVHLLSPFAPGRTTATVAVQDLILWVARPQ